MMADILFPGKKNPEEPRSRSRIGATQRKVLLFLQGGLALAVCPSPKRFIRLRDEIKGELRSIRRDALNQAIWKLYASQLVSTRKEKDGTLTLVLSQKGKDRALSYDLERMAIKAMTRWDGKWRIALFDVPETEKHVREALRGHFKRMGFFEFQKSVFVHPFPCADEIEYLMEFYGARRHLRFIVATEIDNAPHILKHFGLTQP